MDAGMTRLRLPLTTNAFQARRLSRTGPSIDLRFRIPEAAIVVAPE
jgi:hypothetical protein